MGLRPNTIENRVMLSDIEVPKERVAGFCRRRHVMRLAFFGSVLTDRFGPDSDVDVLVDFEPGHVPGLDFVDAEDELSGILRRTVHLNTPGCLSRCFRDKVVAGAEVVHAK